jgi:uncharacterized glyoxalase superfamily protein PhnB
MTPTLKPAGYSTVSPYLVVKGAQAVIDFMTSVFGGEQLRRHDRPDGTIGHAEVRIDDTVVMIADASGPWDPAPTCLHVYVADVDSVYEKALAAGALSIMPPVQKDQTTDTDRRGGVRDSGGNSWWIATQTR